MPAGASLEPRVVINYLQTLKSSEELLREQLEKAKKKEAAFIVTFAKREQEIAELKVSPSLSVCSEGWRGPGSESTTQATINAEFGRGEGQEVKELQDNIAAVNFTHKARWGRCYGKLCSKNGYVAYMISNELAAEITNTELRRLYEHMEGLTNDVEKSNETVLLLQEKLEEKDKELKRLKLQLQQKTYVEEKPDPCPNITASTDELKEAEDN
uniref:Uncharacterized protein n=1 Tax=Salix viminalis TaxID=40686 RepID=A0A6N2LY93_SALVM